MPVTGRRRGLGKVATALVAAGLIAASAAAQDRAVELVTTGPAAGGSLEEYVAVSTSEDGTTVAFATRERLVTGDGDDQLDVYVRRAGTTSIASHGEINGDLLLPASGPVVSLDGSRVFFTTSERLVREDEDDKRDVYEWVDGTTRLVSVRDPGAPGPAADVDLPSDRSVPGNRLPQPADDRVILSTTEKLLSADGDEVTDLYERSASGIRLLTGATNAAVVPLDANRTLTHVFFESAHDMLASDTDGGKPDTYVVNGEELAHVSRGKAPDAGGTGRAWVDLVSPDGARALVITAESLVADDTDAAHDVYLWQAGGGVTFVSKLAGGTGCARPACEANSYGASRDLSRLAFTTPEKLVAADTDDNVDVYAWTADAGPELVSTGPNGGNAAADVAEAIGGRYQKVGADGRGVLFTTGESLLAEDTDAQVDLYERIDGTTRLLSTGEIGASGGVPAGTGTYRAGSERALFSSRTALSRSDTDDQLDVYMRENGTTRVVSVGHAAYDAELADASPDATRIFFRTAEQLATEDADGGRDLYVSRQLPLAGGGGGGPVADTTPPEIGLRITRTSFRGANRRARMSARRKRTPIGTFFDVYVNEGGQVNLSFTKLVPGRRSKGKCVRAKGRVRKTRRCTKPVAQRGKLEFTTQGGRNRIRFYGRVGSRRLTPGAYVVFARAYDGAGNRSRIANARFRIKKR